MDSKDANWLVWPVGAAYEDAISEHRICFCVSARLSEDNV